MKSDFQLNIYVALYVLLIMIFMCNEKWKRNNNMDHVIFMCNETIHMDHMYTISAFIIL